MPSSADPLSQFDAFIGAVRARLEKGRREYGEASFSRPPAELVGELEQEALDLAGWGFVLWCRLRALSEATLAAEAHERPTLPSASSARSGTLLESTD